MNSIWTFRNNDKQEVDENTKQLKEWADKLNISHEIASLLINRGFESYENLAEYLNPSLQKLAPLEQWTGFNAAAKLLGEAILNGKKLGVCGDYDVDGVTSTALVLDFMSQHGFNCVYHIPDRIEEGYGLGVKAVESLYNQGANLILTVDCGITDYNGIKRAKELGMTVVISDHHLPSDKLPDADIICNPRLVPCPCQTLAGVGVAFFLMAALNNFFEKHNGKKIDIRSLLDLVALGTLADMVELKGQNRILVKNGLLLVANPKRIGLAELKAVSGYSPTAQIDAGQLVFNIAPRINAAGRVGKAHTALKLLLTKERAEAEKLASELNSLNTERQNEEELIVKEANLQALEQIKQGSSSLILYAAHWHQGIVGIVASRMVELYHRPTIVLCNKNIEITAKNTDSNTVVKGSGRSVGGFDLHDALTQMTELLEGFGGHKQAAGLTLLFSKLESFKQEFDRLVKNTLGSEPIPQQIKIDQEIDLKKAADFTFLKEIELLQPFGIGNPEPIFSTNDLTLQTFRQKGNLVLIDVKDEKSGLSMKGKAWRRSEVKTPAERGEKITLAFSPRINRYNGMAYIELHLKDWKKSE
ncbi:single-stranded-DNA-specific exonuclease RecJ [Desulfovibrio litoralis]|uniref:Single-stranded-DNA-specific exonuclease RecJ n=1 Tax=Desulfovibrio litoralis DSM 11393 TaxID=1121455 RepID=A0A1M7SG06_9BACT|nr:single-stranded-DNA-specific exonuclease RecJ [Desulfovibrio litoralis]SHN57419.1 exonuclease RecJ [Desulfovibrio litoralis DSM 11393]